MSKSQYFATETEFVHTIKKFLAQNYILQGDLSSFKDNSKKVFLLELISYLYGSTIHMLKSQNFAGKT